MLSEYYSRSLTSDGENIDSFVGGGVLSQIRKERPQFKESDLPRLEPAGINSEALLDPTRLDPDLAKDETIRRAFAILMNK